MAVGWKFSGKATGMAGAGALVGVAALVATAIPSAAVVAPSEPDSRSAQVRASSTVGITGSVAGGAGMTLVALQDSGRAVKKKLPANGAFAMNVKRSGTTLHLIAADGSYYGPVVLRGNGKLGAINGTLGYGTLEGATARSIALGTIVRKGGWAAPSVPVDGKGKKVVTGKKKKKKTRYVIEHVRLTAAASMQSRAGKPIGTGTLGRVAVATAQLLQNGNRPWLDLDRDGLPNAFDIDDNGNKILDNVDRVNRAGSVRSLSARGLSDQGFRMFSNYKATSDNFSDVINVNVATPTPEDLNASLVAKTTLAIQVIPDALLSCTGQAYCPAEPQAIVAGNTQDFQWRLGDDFPSLTSNDIGAGDTFLETVGADQYPGVLNFVFLTTPALKSYTPIDNEGAEGTTVPVDWSAGSKVGSRNSRVPIGESGKVKLEFWRPQRPALSGEESTAGYVDIGGLKYGADAHPGFCNATAGDPSGSTIADGGSTMVRDEALDGVPADTRTLSMIVDMGSCQANVDQPDVDIQASSNFGDNAAQKVFFDRTP